MRLQKKWRRIVAAKRFISRASKHWDSPPHLPPSGTQLPPPTSTHNTHTDSTCSPNDNDSH